MDFSHHAELLARLPLCKGLSPEEVAVIARMFEPIAAGAGQAICLEGEVATALYVLETGRVEVRKRTAQGDEQTLATLEAPTAFGELGLIDGAPRSASVVAVTPVTLYRISYGAFGALKREWHPAAYKVIRNLALMMCERLRETTDRINEFFANPEASLEQMRKRQQQLWYTRQAGRKEP